MQEINNNMSFEEGLKKLEEILEQLENEELPLEESITKYEEGMRYYNFCKEKLNTFEKKIEVLIKDSNDTYKIVPYNREEFENMPQK